MDFTNIDMGALATQLRRPHGKYGKELGKMMAEKNKEAIAFTLSCLEIKAKDRVLEIGFGPGEGIAQAISLATEGFVAGVDYSADMLVMAKKRNHLVRKRIELLLADAEELPYSDGDFDKVFAVNVFHFWPDPTRELAECLRVLKPNGRIAFFMAHPSSWMPGLHETGIFIARTPKDVEKLLIRAHFTDVKSYIFTLEGFKGFAVTGEK